MNSQVGVVKEKDNKLTQFLFLIGIIIVAINLRPAITSVGPLIGSIRDDVGLSNWSVALLTSLPLIAFACMSPIAPKLAHTFSNEKILSLGLFVLVIGIMFRSISKISLIFMGTICVGLGIAILNVLLPGVIKNNFPMKEAIMTSIYTTTMAIFATLASGISVPLSDGLQLGWQLALFVWAIPAIIGSLLWFIIDKKNNRSKVKGMHFFESEAKSRIWQSRNAWMVALFMGLQSLIFYVTISWLPEILMDNGLNKTNAGWMLSYFQFIGIPISFIVPIIAVKMKSQRLIVMIVNMIYLFGITILVMTSSIFNMIFAISFLGISSSANFALALTFLSIKAKTGGHAAELSGMAQSVGYLLAAVGPTLIGFIYDITLNWTIPLYVLMGITVAIIYFGIHAAKNQYVLE